MASTNKNSNQNTIDKFYEKVGELTLLEEIYNSARQTEVIKPISNAINVLLETFNYNNTELSAFKKTPEYAKMITDLDNLTSDFKSFTNSITCTKTLGKSELKIQTVIAEIVDMEKSDELSKMPKIGEYINQNLINGYREYNFGEYFQAVEETKQNQEDISNHYEDKGVIANTKY